MSTSNSDKEMPDNTARDEEMLEQAMALFDEMESQGASSQLFTAIADRATALSEAVLATGTLNSSEDGHDSEIVEGGGVPAASTSNLTTPPATTRERKASSTITDPKPTKRPSVDTRFAEKKAADMERDVNKDKTKYGEDPPPHLAAADQALWTHNRSTLLSPASYEAPSTHRNFRSQPDIRSRMREILEKLTMVSKGTITRDSFEVVKNRLSIRRERKKKATQTVENQEEGKVARKRILKKTNSLAITTF